MSGRCLTGLHEHERSGTLNSRLAPIRVSFLLCHHSPRRDNWLCRIELGVVDVNIWTCRPNEIVQVAGVNPLNQSLDIPKLAAQLRAFASEREWEQFHNPKNLAMSIAIEAGELLELYQWLTLEQASRLDSDPNDRARLEEELADVFIYLVRLADVAQIDLLSAAETKLQENARKYPVDKVRSSARKYTDFDQ